MKASAKSKLCQKDLKKFLCMGGARPCKPGATAADDTRGSVPCEWCQAMVSEKNECSIDVTFSFKSFYSKSDSNTLCAEMTKMLDVKPQSDLINSMGTFFFNFFFCF